MEMGDVLAKQDSAFQNLLEQHISYCSPLIQNEIIGIIAELTINEIKQVNLFRFLYV